MATNGFFGKVKGFFGGKPNEQKSKAVPYQRPTTHHDAPTAHGRKHATGAFGGTGTGRGLRGMPGRKLAKKMVRAGWNAQKRVMPMASRSPK
jgi:hypothetical protein